MGKYAVLVLALFVSACGSRFDRQEINAHSIQALKGSKVAVLESVERGPFVPTFGGLVATATVNTVSSSSVPVGDTDDRVNIPAPKQGNSYKADKKYGKSYFESRALPVLKNKLKIKPNVKRDRLGNNIHSSKKRDEEYSDYDYVLAFHKSLSGRHHTLAVTSYKIYTSSGFSFYKVNSGEKQKIIEHICSDSTDYIYGYEELVANDFANMLAFEKTNADKCLRDLSTKLSKS